METDGEVNFCKLDFTETVVDSRTRRKIIRNKQIQCLLLLLLHRRRRKRLGRKVWVNDVNQTRDTQSEYNGLFQELRLNDHETFVHFNRMTPKQFDQLLNLLGPAIKKETTTLRDPISPGERLAITLRYLATGDSQRTISFSFRVGYSTTSQIVKETCDAIWLVLQPIYLKQLDHAELNAIAERYYQLWDFPNCLGPLDAVRLGIKASSAIRAGAPSTNVIFIASCDADYRFTFVDVGEYQQQNGVFLTSTLGTLLENKSLPIPPPRPLPGGNAKVAVPMLFVGDLGFPLRDYMMRPYPDRSKSNDNTNNQAINIFNYRLHRVISVVQNALGILSSRWGIFRCNIVAKPDRVVGLVKALTCLHNFLLERDHDQDVPREFLYNPPKYADREDDFGNKIEGRWRVGASDCFAEATKLGSNNFTRKSFAIRETLKDYFLSNEGSIPQQYLHDGAL